MCDQRILRMIFSFLSHMKQDIETFKIRVIVDDRLRLLCLDRK